MDVQSNRYRNLADWSHADWKALDIHLYIAINFTRYCTLLLKKVGLQYLPSDASDCLLGLFCDIAYTPLKRVHDRNLDAAGERRNQIMLGTLKMITFTRMVEALIREYPNYITLDQLPDESEQDLLYFMSDDDGDLPTRWNYADTETRHNAYYAAASDDFAYDLTEASNNSDDEEVSQMVEKLRSHLTPIQYRHIRLAICDGLNSQEIAEITGHSVTNVRIMLLNARKRMMELVPPNLLSSMQDCLYRR